MRLFISDSSNHYVAVTVLPGQSYVPVNFIYAPPTTALSVTITSPTNGSQVSGANVNVAVTTTGPVTSLQIQVDGVNKGAAVPVSVNQGPTYNLTLDTTDLMNGNRVLSVIASDANGNTSPSKNVTVTVNNTPGGTTPFIVGQSLGPLRNDYSGFVGLSLTVSGTPITVTSLGRFVAPGNNGTHLLKLVASNGVDVPGGSVSIPTAGAPSGQFKYLTLPAGPLTLQPNTTYYLVSQEMASGDQWYNFGPVTGTAVANVNGPAYTDSANNYVPVGGLPGESYVPVSFLYGPPANTLSASITSPQNGALLSGNNVPVSVTTTGTITSLQLQVDGTNKGAPVAVSGNQPYSLTLDTTGVSNGSHALTVVASDGQGHSAVSPGVNVTVNNGGAGLTAFLTSQTLGPVRNNYTGLVGMEFTVSATPLSVTSLGRYVAPGDTGTHTVKLVQANGADVPGGSVTVNTAAGTPGLYAYANLASPVALSANTTYYLVSQETAGGDSWYDLGPVTSTSVAQVVGPVYSNGGGNLVTVSGLPNYSYVPVSFTYQ